MSQLTAFPGLRKKGFPPWKRLVAVILPVVILSILAQGLNLATPAQAYRFDERLGIVMGEAALLEGRPPFDAYGPLTRFFTQLFSIAFPASPEKVLALELNLFPNGELLAVGVRKISPVLPENTETKSEPSETPVFSFVENELPEVLIYTTHNAETYIPDDGQAKVEGKNGGVSKVAATLGMTLKNNFKVPALVSSYIHDYPDWSLSYSRSEAHVRQLLKDYPSVQMVFDIHRDAGMQNPEKKSFGGRQAARILFIVGSDKRLNNPKWEKNLEFARLLNSELDRLYPGLSRGVRIQDGRYNQHLHPRTLLVEIGNSLNNLEESQYSAELLASAISSLLGQIKDDTTL